MRAIRPSTSPAAPRQPFNGLEAGDTVALRMKDGRTARFIVGEIEGDTIVAQDGTRYAGADITDLQGRSFSVPKTAGLVGGIVAGLVLFAVIAAEAFSGGYAALP